MSYSEAASCKLPLLDGEHSTRAQIIVTELEPENIGRLQSFGNGDVSSFNDLLCTAWGLLLRCYTGQDDISFHFLQSVADDSVSKSIVPETNQCTFRAVFDEHESLSTCFAKAKDGYAGNKRGSLPLVSTVSDSRRFPAAGLQNTYVWVKDSTHTDTRNVAVQKVS